MRSILVAVFITVFFTSAIAAPRGGAPDGSGDATPLLQVDNNTYIDGNSILMFVTNHGSFGRDLSDVFGYDYGTFYPYFSIADIESGSAITSPLYTAGLWVGGKVDNQVRVTVSEYSSEFVAGPMSGGTYLPDQPAFRVYKLFDDSLESNPNQDYLNWPVDQGAPIDGFGRPAMRGRQMLWAVYNDANPNRHDNNAGETAPLGIEVKQTFWVEHSELDIPIVIYEDVEVTHVGSSSLTVFASITNTVNVTGHTYAIYFRESAEYGVVWEMRDMTTGITVLTNQPALGGQVTDEYVDGLAISVQGVTQHFGSFDVVANANGVVAPALPGALASAGFPTPGDTDPGFGQQANGSRWAIHTADNGGSSGSGTRADFSAFVNRCTRDGNNWETIGLDSYEMRFTGSNASPGVGGSYAIEWFNDDNVFWVPFELWRIGETPDDPSDDVRLVPFIIDDGNDDVYALESWGSDPGGTCHADCEHSASPGDDDPFTDWVYWYLPTDQSPGESGYLASEAQMLAGTFDASLINTEVFGRTVLIAPDAGEMPLFAATTPEQGTVFRIAIDLTVPPDTFLITPSDSTIQSTALPYQQTIFMEYELVNEGGNVIDSCFVSLWTDPDLGGAGDDLVGSDSAGAFLYCYNANNSDQQYGARPPAIGFKFLQGPVGASGDVPLYSMNKYINGTDPDSFLESYLYMQGLDGKTGDPYTYNGIPTRFVHAGDPVSGIGDIDSNPQDKRLMGSFGPFTFNPGDTQVVQVKMAVAPGADRLNSLSILRDILAFDLAFDPDAPLSAYAVSANGMIPPIPKLPVDIVLGQLDSHPSAEIDPVTVRLNGALAPDSTSLAASHPVMAGEVLVLTYRAARLFDMFQPTVSGQTEPFRISFETNDGQAYEAQGELSFQLIFVGDLNGDQLRNLTDLTLLVNYLFVNNQEPAQLMAGDVNCDGKLTLTDVTLFVNGLFRRGTLPDVCVQD